MSNGKEGDLSTDNSHSTIAQQSSDQSKKLSLWQGLITSLAAFFLINLALGFFLYSILEILTPNANTENAFSLLLLAAGFFTVGFLLIPPIIFAFCRFIGWHVPTWLSSLRFPPLAVLVVAYPLIVLGGSWVSHSILAFFLLPFFHILAIGTPIMAILQISLKGLDVSPQRRWGSLSVGLTLTPLLIFILELFAFLFPLTLLMLWISIDPERLKQFSQLNEILGQPLVNPQVLVDVLQPYLIEPSVVLTLLYFAGLVVPLVEEAIKPLSVWLLFGRTRGALDGFVAGALCGAGYALLESFMLGSTKSDWLMAALGRSGTGAIHIFTTALIGAALTTAWQNHRYLRVVFAYLIGVFFHGVWNGFAILSALQGISASNQGFWELPLTQNLASAGPWVIFLLACLAVLGLWSFNQQIRREWSKIGATQVEGFS